jgi:phage replication O-like protein O
MEDKELQVENGNFTRIINPVIDELIKIPFKGCELSVALFIIRKTWGYGKTEDSISLTQFQKGLNRSRQTIVTALKNLCLVNTVRLVKRGSIKNDSNIWRFNKYIASWNLVNTVRLVKRNAKPSLMEGQNLVQPVRHTKERQKKTKEILSVDTDDKEINSEVTNLINLWSEKWQMASGGNKPIIDWATYKSLAKRRIKEIGYEKMVMVCTAYFIQDDPMYRKQGWEFKTMMSSSVINSLQTKI